MSKPRRRKQKKQVKPELRLRQFAATELSDQLAAQHSAADLPRFMVDTVAGAYAPTDAQLMIEGFGAAATRPVTLRANTLKATAEDIAATLDAADIAHCPRRMVPGCLHPARGPRYPICGTSTSTVTARSTCRACRR